MTYQMQAQLLKGEEAERQLDTHFADRFLITPATRQEQRQGIDRIFTKRDTGRQYKIEYKTDWTAGRTGNAFVETVSVDTMNVLGWVYTSLAQWLIYFVPARRQIFIVRVETLRAQIETWIAQFGPEKAIPNDDYFTWGVPVPLAEFEKCCQKIEMIA
ncbi:MAG: hypothetical protein R3A44_08910 [Caldilineaceae bacterium]